MFGFDFLRQPKDWQKVTDAALARCRSFISEIRTTPPGRRVLHLIDDISFTICHAVDSANFCSSAHADPEWRQEALGTLHTLNDYLAALNTEHVLYDGLRATLASKQGEAAAGSDATQWTREEVIVARSLLHEFQQAGMGLSGAVQDSYRKLKTQEQMLTMQLQRYEGEQRATKTAAITMPPSLAASYNLTANHAVAQKPGFVTAMTNAHAQHALLGDLNVPSEIRRQAYQALHSLPEQVEQLLVAMTGLRKDIASLVNYPSYMHYCLDRGSLAASPDAVSSYLQDLLRNGREAAAQDAEALARTARDAGLLDHGASLTAWDVPAANELRFRALAQQQNGGHVRFPLAAALETLFETVHKVFGVTFVEKRPNEGEVWAPRVTKYEAYNDDNGYLGTIFLDLYRRPGKYTGNAHFMIQCGKQTASGQQLRPISVMVFAFSRPQSDISFSQVQTLFHEFGHALNTLMCDNLLQHYFGARGALDIVELPSHLLEAMASQPLVLDSLARRSGYSQDEAASIRRFIQSREDFGKGLASASSLVMPCIDVALHRDRPPESVQALRDLVATCQGDALPYTPMHGTYDHFSLNHFVTYAGLFYSYKYAEAIAERLLTQVMADGDFDPARGRRVGDALFRPGGAIDAAATLAELDSSCLVQVNGGVKPM